MSDVEHGGPYLSKDGGGVRFEGRGTPRVPHGACMGFNDMYPSWIGDDDQWRNAMQGIFPWTMRQLTAQVIA